MQRRAWWDAAVAITVIACGFLLWLDTLVPSVPRNTAGAFAALAAFAISYAAFGRWLIGRHRPVAAQAYLLVMSVTVALGCAADPNLAVLQVVAYPLIGCLAPGRAPAMVAWDAALALAVFAGLALGPAGPTAAAITATLSFGFAVAIGLWIWRISTWGEERAHLLSELQAAQERAASAAEEAGAARERERLARDMHDTVAQSLTGLVMLAERAERQATGPGGAAGLTDTLATIEDAARETLREIRALVAESASQSVDGGLTDAARRVSARFARETDIAVTVDFDDVALAREQEVVLLRCLQEALANVRKHARAGTVEASLRASADSVLLEVVDDGVGVDGGGTVGEGFGVAGMQERLRSLGGAVTLGPATGGGARLAVRVPVHAILDGGES